MFQYQIYNIIIQSDFPILNFPEVHDKVSQASIFLSSNPSKWIPEGQYGTYYSKEVLALGTKYGTLEVTKGTDIEVFIREGYTTEQFTPIIIGWGFAFLFSQRNYTIFHCSALNMSGHGVMVSGASGAGKSSTALSLIQKGAQYLADDMVILNPAMGPDIIPSYPIQKVCRDQSLTLQTDKLIRINEGRDKYAYYNTGDYCSVPVPMTHLVILTLHDGDQLIAKEHKGLNKWLLLLSCMYLNELFVTFGTPESDKNNCLKLSSHIRVLEILRPSGQDTKDKITEIIQNFVNS